MVVCSQTFFATLRAGAGVERVTYSPTSQTHRPPKAPSTSDIRARGLLFPRDFFRNSKRFAILFLMAGFASSFIRYLERSTWFSSPLVLVLSSSLLLIIVEYLTRVRFSPNPFIAYGAYWIVLVVVLYVLTELAAPRLRHEEDRLMVSLFVSGLVIGLALAIYKAIALQELWTLFNLLAEPMRTALVGLIIAWLYLLRERTSAMTRLPL